MPTCSIRPALLSLLVLGSIGAIAPTASADDGRYLGVGAAAGGLGPYILGWELEVDAGMPIRSSRWLYGRGALTWGMTVVGDDGAEIIGATGGLEARTTGRRLRAVAGIDLGVGLIDSGGYGADADRPPPVAPLISVHAGGELQVGRTILRLGVSTLWVMPMLGAGVAVRL